MPQRIRSAASWIAASAVYAGFWIATRWPAIRANTLFFDDFALPSAPALFTLGPYRPLLYCEYVSFEALLPGHFWTVLPKIAGAIYLGAAAAALAALLRGWRIPPIVAYGCPLVALAHPVLNEIGLWQTVHALGLALFFVTLGAVFWTGNSLRSLAIGALFTLIGVLGYQIFVSLALFYIVADALIVERGWQRAIRRAAVRLAAAVGVALISAAVMFVIRRMLPGADPRGFARPTALIPFAAEKMHGMMNLAMNGTAPVIAWYAGARQALHAWTWPPVAIALCTLSVVIRRLPLGRAFAISSLPIAAMVIPALPSLALSQSPYAWRVSAPVVFALAVSIAPLVGQLPRPVALLMLAGAVGVLLPASIGEARLRVKSYDRDTQLMRGIVNHWQVRGVSMRDVRLLYSGPGGEDPRLIGNHDLTWGPQRRTPEMWTEFSNSWFAAKFAKQWGGVVTDCSKQPAACAPFSSLCSAGCSDLAGAYPRVVFVDTARVTLFCTERPSPVGSPCR